MKTCPFCAESIQDAAVKCRYCGEWLDPTKRPPWSEPAPQSTAAAENDAGGDDEPETEPKPWSAPAWGAAAAATNAPTTGPAPAGRGDTLLGLGPDHPAATPSEPTAAATSLEEVARRMERIKASAAVVRDALAAREAATQRAAPPAVDATEPARPSATLVPEASTVVPPAAASPVVEPAPAPPPSTGRAADAEPTPVTQPEPAAAPGTSPRSAAAAAAVATPGTTSVPAEESGTAAKVPPPQPSSTLSDGAGSFTQGFFDDATFDDESGASHLGGSTLGSVVASRRPMPWGPIVLTAAALVVVGYFAFGRSLLHPEGTEKADGTVEGPAPAVQESGVRPPATGKAAADAPPPTPEQPPAPAAAGTEQAAPSGGTGAEGAAVAETAPAATTGAKTRPATADTALPPELATRLDEAKDLYKRGKRKKAAEALADVLEHAPEHPAALLLQAQILLEDGKMDEAAKVAAKCVDVDPKLADCWLTVGVLAQNEGKKDEAVTAYRTYLELAPDGTYARDVKAQLARLEK